MHELDHGVRCDRHVGEVFPPRCRDCMALALEDDTRTAPSRFARPLTGGDCPLHDGYPLPCARCEREAA